MENFMPRQMPEPPSHSVFVCVSSMVCLLLEKSSEVFLGGQWRKESRLAKWSSNDESRFRVLRFIVIFAVCLCFPINYKSNLTAELTFTGEFLEEVAALQLKNDLLGTGAFRESGDNVHGHLQFMVVIAELLERVDECSSILYRVLAFFWGTICIFLKI